MRTQLAEAAQFIREHPLAVAGCIVSAATRIIPHPVNMTSLTAFGLFSGAKLSPMVAASLCLVLMVVTDLLLGWIQVGAAWNTQREFNAFGSWTAFTYVAFAIDVVIGHKLARRTENPGYIGLAALLGATQFFVISNFGVWATESMYTHDFAGLIACYAAAIPFFWRQALGDLGYTAIYFVAHALLSKNVPAFRFESVEMECAMEEAGEHRPLADDETPVDMQSVATQSA